MWHLYLLLLMNFWCKDIKMEACLALGCAQNCSEQCWMEIIWWHIWWHSTSMTHSTHIITVSLTLIDLEVIFICQVVYTLYCVMVDSRREGWLIQKCLRVENWNLRQCWQRTGSSVCSTGHFVRVYSLLNSNFYTGQTCRYGTSNVVFVSENSNSVVGSVTASLQVKCLISQAVVFCCSYIE